MPKLRLKFTHTHAGVAYPAGHDLDVDEHTARWLIAHQIADFDTDHAESAPITTDVPAKAAKVRKE